MHNAVKWPNILWKSYGVNTARFLKYVLPFYNMNERVKADIVTFSMLLFSKFWQSTLLKLQEVSKASDYAPSRTFYLFRVDMPQVARLLLNRCYQVISLGPVCFVISIWPTLMFQHYLQFRKKWLEQSKEIKQNWTGRKNFDICFYVIFGCYDHQFISGRDSGH